MLTKDIAAKRFNFALEKNLKPGSFKAQIKSSDTRKKRGDSV